MQAPTGLNHIPAMTTDAERTCYYRLVREALAAGEPGPSAPLGAGAIVELGAWLGASTAYIAAAIRDSGSDKKVHVFDKFQSKPGHERKVSAFYEKQGTTSIPIGPSLEQFRVNLGELMRHVRVQRGQIEAMEWPRDPAPDGHGGPIAVMITDAPKRVPAISAVLTRLREAIVGPSASLETGTIMAWQDFCHFPSYEIPACLYRLRDHLELVEAVVPGTTLVFRVKSQWTAEEVSLEALALHRWTPAEIDEAWEWWLANGVPAEKAALFRCGATMFACDIGIPDAAVAALAVVKAGEHADVEKKWAYLRDSRPDFVRRYAPLFELMAAPRLRSGQA